MCNVVFEALRHKFKLKLKHWGINDLFYNYLVFSGYWSLKSICTSTVNKNNNTQNIQRAMFLDQILLRNILKLLAIPKDRFNYPTVIFTALYSHPVLRTVYKM